MEWSQEVCLSLIEEFRSREVLWNPRNSYYYNKIKKEDAWAWAEIAAIVQKDIEEIKKKFDSLKGSYRREKNRVKKSYGTGIGRKSIYTSKWFAYDALHFLDDKDEPRKSLNNVESPSSEPSTCDKEEQIFEDNPDDSELNTTTDTTEKDPPIHTEGQPKDFKSPSTPKKKRVLKHKMSSEENSTIDKALSYLKQATDFSQRTQDRCSIFGDFVADKLRKLDNRYQAIAEHKIHTILFELEMKTLKDSRPNTMMQCPDQIYSYSHASTSNSTFTTTSSSTSSYGQNLTVLTPYSPQTHYNNNRNTFIPQYNEPALIQVSPPSSSPLPENQSSLGGYFSNFSDTTGDSSRSSQSN